MSNPVILTGLRANNDLHIGNYLGALLPLVDMAKTKSSEYQINLFVPDLHSFTTPIDHSKLQEQIIQNLRVFVAAGLPLDNDNVHIYRQSYVPAHSELTIILNSFTGFGEMSRMTQFKEKGRVTQLDLDDINPGLTRSPINETLANLQRQNEELIKYIQKSLYPIIDKERFVSVGLFDYPVLMAADILLYNATYVPVGDDQTQHLEFTRDIAERMNNKFGELFVVPKAVKEQHAFFGKDQGLRIKDLQDPSKKMSKSDESEKGIIFMSDSPEEAKKKIMSATTDSLANVAYDPENQPGIANLLQIHALLSAQSLEDSTKQFEGQTQYGEFKAAVADVVASFLADFQNKLVEINDEKLLTKLKKDEELMNEIASQTLQKVQKAVGLRS